MPGRGLFFGFELEASTGGLLSGMLDGLVQAAFEQLHGGEFGEVFAHADGSGIELEKFHLLGIGRGTEDEADGRFLPWGAFVFVQPAKARK